MRLLIGLVLMVLTACQPKSTTEKKDYSTKADSLKFEYKPYKVINPTNNVDSIKGFIDGLVNTKELSHREPYNFVFRSYLHDENFMRLMLAEDNSIPLLIERIDDTTQTTAFFSKPYKKSPFVLGQICLILVDWKVEYTPFWTIYNKVV